MPTYIMLANWTDQGAQKVKDSPRRLDTAKKALADMGEIHYAKTDITAQRAEDARMAADFDARLLSRQMA